MKFTKGMKKQGGRRPDTPNRVNVAFRDAVSIVYDNIGGHNAFTQWAKRHRTEYYRIAARLIPVEIRDPDRDKTIVIVNRNRLPIAEAVSLPAIEDHSSDDNADTSEM
jgi:hypothetical protein